MTKIIKTIYILFCMVLILSLSGCGDNKALDEYQEKMELFFEKLGDYDNAMNSLDPDLDSSISDMIYYLEGISEAIHEMAAYEVPDLDSFDGIEELAKQANEYMTEAVSLYREAYLASEYNDDLAEAAYENYERANLRLRYIVEILRGDIPEEIFVTD